MRYEVELMTKEDYREYVRTDFAYAKITKTIKVVADNKKQAIEIAEEQFPNLITDEDFVMTLWEEELADRGLTMA
jgi:type II secretory pathway predicted ATPase ExeA